MTDAPSVRSGWVRPRRVPGRLGAVGVTRLLVFQVFQVGLFLVLVQGVWAAVWGGVVGGLAITATFGRWRGRWVSEHALLWLGYRLRRGVGGARRDDPRLAALAALVPDLRVVDIEGTGPGPARWGMGSDSAGWFAVLEVAATDSAVRPPVPLAALARVAAEAEQSGVVMQVVSHTVPVIAEPGTVLHDRQHLLWIAVRLDARAVADSVVDDPVGGVDVPAVLAEITRRARRVLRRRGLPTQVLDADGVIDALVLSCDLPPAAPADPAAAGAPAPGREEWEAWHSARLAHRCFWLQRWPAPEPSTDLLASFNELPGARVSLALVLAPRFEEEEQEATNLRCLVRIAALPARCRRLSDHAERLAARAGGRLFPLNGEQALAVYCTAPGGGASL